MSKNETLIKQINEAQKAWGDGIVSIGKEELAIETFVKDLYYFEGEEFKTLFKPTLTSFITSKERVIEYFEGFARNPRIKKVWFNNWEILPIDKNLDPTKQSVIVNGVYNFLTRDNVITAEYSFVYRFDFNSDNKSASKHTILLQHSSLPMPLG